MSEVKKVPRKLRDGPTIMVDEQILRRRKKLRAKGMILGRASAKAKEHADKIKKERALPPIRDRKFF